MLGETEWRGIGVQQSRGWAHYACHRPEPQILLFRRPLGTDPVSGKVDPELEREAKDAYNANVAAKMVVPHAAKAERAPAADARGAAAAAAEAGAADARK